MVEVDPKVLIGIGSAMVGIPFFSMSKKDDNQEINTEAATKPKATAKPSKKNSKSKTSKKADASSASEGDFEVKKERDLNSPQTMYADWTANNRPEAIDIGTEAIDIGKIKP